MADPSTPTTDLAAQVEDLRRRLDALDCVTADSVLHNGTPSGVDFLSSMDGRPGYVVDPAVARESPCIAYELGERGQIVFAHGVVGPLDAEQRDLYCEAVETRELTPAQRDRLLAMDEAARACQVPKNIDGDRVETWVSCMDRELREHGQRL